MTGNEWSKYLNTGFVLWATFIFLLTQWRCSVFRVKIGD